MNNKKQIRKTIKDLSQKLTLSKYSNGLILDWHFSQVTKMKIELLEEILVLCKEWPKLDFSEIIHTFPEFIKNKLSEIQYIPKEQKRKK